MQLREKVKKELISLCTGELAAVISFWFWFFMFKKWLVDPKMMLQIMYPLMVLSFILIQGSIYWFVLFKRMSNPKFLSINVVIIYRIFKIIDVILLCIGILVIVLNYSNIAVTILSVFILLFSIIEWINYYIVRLSYSYNPNVLIGHLKNKTLKKVELQEKSINDKIHFFEQLQAAPMGAACLHVNSIHPDSD